jgi:hypothetical protein
MAEGKGHLFCVAEELYLFSVQADLIEGNAHHGLI